MAGRITSNGTFLSTLSLRRATGRNGQNIERRHISIHALLAESDATDAVNGCNPDYISIHALLAESDENALRQIVDRRISIHALLAESDEILYILF